MTVRTWAVLACVAISACGGDGKPLVPDDGPDWIDASGEYHTEQQLSLPAVIGTVDCGGGETAPRELTHVRVVLEPGDLSGWIAFGGDAFTRHICPDGIGSNTRRSIEGVYRAREDSIFFDRTAWFPVRGGRWAAPMETFRAGFSYWTNDYQAEPVVLTFDRQ